MRACLSVNTKLRVLIGRKVKCANVKVLTQKKCKHRELRVVIGRKVKCAHVKS